MFYSLPFPASTTFTEIEGGAYSVFYTLSYCSKKHFRLVLDFHRSSSSFFSRWIASLL